MADSRSRSRVTSQGTTRTRRPVRRSSAARASRRSMRRAARARSAPCRANSRASAAPMPDEAPVMKTTWLANTLSSAISARNPCQAPAERSSIELRRDGNSGGIQHGRGDVVDGPAGQLDASRHPLSSQDDETVRRVAAAATVLSSETERPEARRVNGVPREILVPAQGNVGQLVEERPAELVVDERDLPYHRPVADRVRELAEGVRDVLTDPPVLVPRRHRAIPVAPLHADAYRSHRVVVRERERPTSPPVSVARIPEEKQPLLQ